MNRILYFPIGDPLFMPPSAIKTIRDLIYWQYAKLIAKSAGFEENYGFIMSRFQKLKNEQKDINY